MTPSGDLSALTAMEMRHALRRRIYLAALALGLPVLLMLWRLEAGHAPENLLYPALLAMTLFGVYWVYSHRPLTVMERTIYVGNALAILALFTLGERSGPQEDALRIASTHLLLIANTVLGYLMFSARLAGALSVAGFVLGVTANTAILWSRGDQVTLVTAARLHLSVATILLLVYALAWYRGSFLRMYDEHHRLRREAFTDPLTGLANRRAAYTAIDGLLRQAQDGVPGSVILLDIDNFKQVNDTYGHPVGDQVLGQVAQFLREHLRAQDTPVRWGGEEFMLILPGTSLDGAQVMAERLRQAIQVQPLPGTRGVTASFGLTGWQPGDDLGRLTARADHALYEAKKGGRNQVIVHTGPSDGKLRTTP